MASPSGAPTGSGKRRPTISDVARAAGVAKSAVSYALNDKPGVSKEKRRHILAVAERIGWQPSSAARALMGTRVGLMGLVLNRPARLLGLEPFYMELISGMQEVLGPLDIALALQIVEAGPDELAVYRGWAAKREVDAVVVTDISQRDPRLALLRDLGLPAVVLSPPLAEADPTGFGPPEQASAMPWLWTDDITGMRMALRYLVALGHRQIARVAGISRYLHTAARTTALRQEAERLGLPEPAILTTDYSQEQGADATRSLLIGQPRPTAIIYDNDVMAATALQVARELRLEVPRQLSVIAWDDSMIAHLTAPKLTSIKVDVHAYGMRVASALDGLAGGSLVESGPFGLAGLEVRDSTGAAPEAA
ncbi:MAG: LacI family transcriptional regulator [Propionibacteriaceae bacterium]|nr:LacI family transcriptional regulator [Propionibacteriaceae bacterium]